MLRQIRIPLSLPSSSPIIRQFSGSTRVLLPFPVNLTSRFRASPRFRGPTLSSRRVTSPLPVSILSKRYCSFNSAVKEATEKDEMASKHLATDHTHIFENNRKWVAQMKEEDPEFFVKLSSGQNPDYLYFLPSFHAPQTPYPNSHTISLSYFISLYEYGY